MKQINLFCLFFIKIKSKTAFLILLLFSSFYIANAQDVIVASGGDISGGGGSVSYSIGQIIQSSITGTGGSVFQGIQISFESATLSIIDLENNLNVSAYPNPTTSILNLKINKNLTNELSYSLFNLLGETIISGKIIGDTAKINIDHLPNATYLLEVINNTTNTIQTFKIIKN